jgi:hypothetical protein
MKNENKNRGEIMIYKTPKNDVSLDDVRQEKSYFELLETK